jgi:hypothetical protein
MSHMAYVLFHTSDGVNFEPEMDEGYWSPDYPTIHPFNSQNMVIQPGPLAEQGDKDAVFVGWSDVALLLIRTVDSGKSLDTIDIGAHIDDLPDYYSPLGISFTDARHGWLAGRRNGQGIILRTTDGATFQAVP